MIKHSLNLHILVALAAGQNYGYGIYKQMLEDPQYDLVVYERSIYRELPRLIKAGLVEVVNPVVKPVRYQLTPMAMRWLRIEQKLLLEMSQLLRERLP